MVVSGAIPAFQPIAMDTVCIGVYTAGLPSRHALYASREGQAVWYEPRQSGRLLPLTHAWPCTLIDLILMVANSNGTISSV